MLTSQYAPSKQAGNGVITAFSGSFKILAQTDLAVYKIDASGVQSGLLVLGTDYTVSFESVQETWTVTYTTPPVLGGYALIERVSDNTQETSLPREGYAPAKTVEAMADKLQAQIQELSAMVAAFVLTTMPQVQVGSFAQLAAFAALNPTVPFAAIVTDSKTFQVYTGNVNLGNNGWWAIGGGS